MALFCNGMVHLLDATGNFVKVWSLTNFNWRQILRTFFHFSSLVATVLKSKNILRISRQLNLVRLQTLTKFVVVSSQCTMLLQKGAILLYVTVYKYFHLRQISKQLGCYSPKMQQSSENQSLVECSEASNFDKIPSYVNSVHHAVTEWSHSTLC